jgi:PilZ domain
MNPKEVEIKRRRSPRVEVFERLQGRIRPLDIPITLLNLSQDGFLMQAPMHYPTGGIHEFSFTMADHDPIVLSARVVHGMRATAGQVASHMIGLEFVDRGVPACEQGIASLVARLPRLSLIG